MNVLLLFTVISNGGKQTDKKETDFWSHKV